MRFRISSVTLFESQSHFWYYEFQYYYDGTQYYYDRVKLHDFLRRRDNSTLLSVPMVVTTTSNPLFLFLVNKLRLCQEILTKKQAVSQEILTKTLLQQKQPSIAGISMSKSFVAMLVLIFLVASCVIMFLPVKAESRTIIVPDDYSTIQDAINAANEGDTIFVKKGTYEEKTLEINKALSLIGENANNTITTLHPAYTVTWIITTPFFSYSNAITINANDVKLLNLTIIIAIPGGYISATGDRTQIIGNNISTGPTTGLLVSGSYCNITENISGGLISLKGSSNTIARNRVQRIILEYGDSNTISDNTCKNLYLGSSNQACSYNIISRNRIETPQYGWSGILIGNSSHNVFYANNITGFIIGAALGSDRGGNNTFYHNSFINNDIHASAKDPNFWDNGEEGNYWDDYNGTDSNRDGIGDAPYVINGGNIDNYPLMRPFDIENNTVVLPPPKPFPTTPVIAVSIALAVAVGGLLIYLKKRKR